MDKKIDTNSGLHKQPKNQFKKFTNHIIGLINQ